MKTFFNLIQDVQKKGKCHQCGGCVTFCSAINYGALDVDSDGKPYFSHVEKCVECGICYMICPETGELDQEIKKRAEWSAPAGRIIGTHVARARDLIVRERGTDGGVVTAILLHLFDTGRINGAIVSRNTDKGRIPWLATTPDDILDAAGTHFDHSHGMAGFGEHYSTFSPSVQALSELRRQGLDRIAFVGTPCQINTIRRMQAIGVVPSETIKVCLGLFCSGNFIFSQDMFRVHGNPFGADYKDIEKINIKDDFIIRLTTGEQRQIPVKEMAPFKRKACSFCQDFGAEYADIAFGGLGADQGWTSVITRTPLGRAMLADASEKVLDSLSYRENPVFASSAEDKIIAASRRKSASALENLKKIDGISVTVVG